MNIIKRKWIFRKKPLDAQGKTFLPKARCVARGDLQEAYVDFDPDTLYAPVAAHASIRLILAYAASQNLIIEGGDISNAYLYGEIDETIYMDQPTNSSGKTRKPVYVCKLLKSIYGVKQAGNIWGSVVHGDLVQWGFKVSKFDSLLYFLRIGEDFIILALVVDDTCFATNNRELLDQLKFKLSAKFDVKFYGSLTSFMGWNITHAPQGLKLDQTENARSLLKTCGMGHCKAVSSPLPIGAGLLPTSPHEQLLSKRDHQAYRAIVGGLLYLSVCTRPDLSFLTSALARQMHSPCDRHFKYLKRILRYVAGTLEYGLFYPRLPCTPSSIGAAFDADWGGDIETRRSTTGYLIAINGSPLYWQSKRQTVVTLSSAEAEYVALSTCAKTISWFRNLYWEICHQTSWVEGTSFDPTRIAIDSTAAQSLASNSTISTHNKHISLKFHHVCEMLKERIISLYHVRSHMQPADMLTKILSRIILEHMVDMIHLRMYMS